METPDPADPDQLAEALRHTQDRVMALEAQVRVLAASLVGLRLVSAEHLEAQMTEAIRQLHGRHPDEFPQVVRAMALLRDFLREGVQPSPPPRSSPENS